MKRILIAASVKDGNAHGSLRFIRGITAVGGVPVIGAALTEEDAARLADHFDALLLTGGADVPPARYDQAPHRANRYEDPMRDTSDEWLTHAFRARGKRVMGVCRGCQAINVYLGGTLHQHLPDAYDPVLWHAANLEGRHAVHVENGSVVEKLLADRLSGAELMVNTSHHQAIDRPGDGLAVTAIAPDGVIEAAEGDGVLLIQWHPEYMDGEHDALFEWLAG